MTRPKSKLPVESFGPELLQALMAGALGEVKLKMPYGRAARFRQRIYQLRHAMRQAGHEKYELCSRVRISIVWSDGSGIDTHARPDRGREALVVLSPHDSEFSSALLDAGLGISLPSAPPIEAPSLDEARESRVFFDELLNRKV